MLPTHELVILTKLRNNRARIVDFLLILQFGPSLIFSGQSLLDHLHLHSLSSLYNYLIGGYFFS